MQLKQLSIDFIKVIKENIMSNNVKRTLPIMGKCEMFVTPRNIPEYVNRMLDAFTGDDTITVVAFIDELTDYYKCIIAQLKGNNSNTNEYKTFDLQDFFENSIAQVDLQLQIYAYTLAYGITNYYFELITELENTLKD